MLNFNFVTLFPKLIEPVFENGVISRAVDNKLIQYHFFDPRDFTHDIHKTVDDRPFGGGDGMLMLAKPVADCLDSIANKGRVIYLSPQGSVFNDSKSRELAQLKNLTVICGRYSGIDQRLINKYVDEEISIGDYVLSGGELAAGVVADAVARQIDGVLGHEKSNQEDSFANGLLEGPSFTKPRTIFGQSVPEILLSGDHARIAEFRKLIGVLKTMQVRPDIEIDPILRKSALALWTSLTAEEKDGLGMVSLRLTNDQSEGD